MTTLIGVSNNSLAVLETALGTKVPVVRDYSWFGKPFPASWASLLNGRQGVVSFKMRDANGAAFPATQINAGKWDAVIDAQGAALAAMPDAPFGRKHAVIAHHEADSQASASSGTNQQINDAFVYWANRISKVPGFLAKCEVWFCAVGWQMSNLAAFNGAIAVSAGIVIDQPYRMQVTDTTSGWSNLAPRLQYLATNYPTKKTAVGEYGCVASAADRIAWMDALAAQLLSSKLDFACYWDNATNIDYHVSATSSQASLVASMKASLPPSTVTISLADFKTLIGLAANANTDAVALQAMATGAVDGATQLQTLATQAAADVKALQGIVAKY